VTAERRRSWPGVVALVVATAALSAFHPALLIFVPLALLLVGLPPRRPALMALAVLVGWLVLRRPSSPDALWHFERGWALLLGSWFLVLSALLPAWRFLSRAMASAAATLASVALFLTVRGNGLAPLDQAVGDAIRSQVTLAISSFAGTAGFERLSEQTRSMMYAMADLQAELYPALLGLASVAALGVAWWAYGRLARGEIHPLGRLREFRFRDELVWLLIAGVILLVLPFDGQPLDGLATRAGQNLLTFMGVLYALRGLAVVLMVAGVPGPFGLIVGGLAILLMYPFVMATAFLVGLSDTWLDIRARRRMPSNPGS